MKKVVILCLCLIAAGNLKADNDVAITFDELPTLAQQFVNEYFGAERLSYAKKDVDLDKTGYEVIFTDGTKAEFDRKGNWLEIKCKYSEVPDRIIPPNILAHVKENFQGFKIVGIDRDSKNYYVKLGNGQKLKYTLKAEFLGCG